MTDTYQPIRPRARIVAAALGLIAAAGLLGAVLALDVHYDNAFLQAQHSAATTQHATAPAPADTQAVHG